MLDYCLTLNCNEHSIFIAFSIGFLIGFFLWIFMQAMKGCEKKE